MEVLNQESKLIMLGFLEVINNKTSKAKLL